MGRFDILTQLEEKQTAEPVDVPVPPSSERSPAAATQPAAGKKQRASGKNPAPQQPEKSVNALQPKQEKFDKYSTYLRPGYKKELKSIALELDCKDYEILDE